MSFEISVKMEVPKDVFKALNSKRVDVAITRGMKEIGKDLVKTAKTGMLKKTRKTGRLYNYKGRIARAGAEGEYPQRRSGTLHRSLSFTVGGHRLDFGTNTKYAKYLQQYKTPEQRSSSWRRIAPRPFLTLAHDKNKDNFENIMRKNFINEFNL